jgi:RNA exonuclease 4
LGEFLRDRILVGHGLKRDLEVLKMTHPREKIRDTSLYEAFRAKYSAGKIPSLKKIVQEELGVIIQNGEHDSIEDAQGAMALFRRIREEYEKAVRMGHLHGIRPKVEELDIPSRRISNEGSTK